MQNQVHSPNPQNANPQDVALIRQFVAAVEKAHNHKTPEEFSRTFAEDAVFVNAAGVRWHGRDQIYQAAKKAMEGVMARSYARYELKGIQFIRDDVALVSMEQHPTDKDGELLGSGPKGVPTYVLAKKGEQWVAVAGQNTLVQDE